MALVSAGDALGTQHLNGFVVVPTVHTLATAGILEGPAVHGWIALTEAYRAATGREAAPERLGGLLAAVRTLGLKGWAELRGRGADSSLRLTPAGRAMAAVAAAHHDLLADAAAFIRGTTGFLSEIWSDRRLDGGITDLLDRLSARMATRWQLTEPPGAGGQQAAREMRIALDGVLVCPLLVALGRSDGLHHLQPGDPLPPAPWHHPALTRVLVTAGLAARDGGDVRLSKLGADRLHHAADYGVTVSYADVLGDLSASVFGESSRTSRSDSDVSRATNIWGSAGHSALRRLRSELIRDVLLPVFDRPALAEQPAGLADTGCGSGLPLREVAELVIRHTRRGRHLDTHPLLVVGGDISPDARERSARTLAGLADTDGVTCLVLEADVGEPESYDAAVRARSLDLGLSEVGLGDLLHLQMFLLHDRELSVCGPGAALDQLREALAMCSPSALVDALALMGVSMRPSDPEDALSVVTGEFTVDQCDGGTLVPGLVAAADLVATVRRWRPYLRHGLLMAEAHAPRLTVPSVQESGPVGDTAVELDPSPAVWGVHAASSQFLMPQQEHELAMVLGGLACAYRRATGTSGVSVAHWVHSEEVYFDLRLRALPDFAFPPPDLREVAVR
ncbi:hypothetical protein [Streptomyces canus]|uniref:AprA-related methyltransferase n=1 Tax=Streptomyces canus TaxID=58343 RepID=UPI0036E2EFF8